MHACATTGEGTAWPAVMSEFTEFAQACSPRLLHAAYLLTGNRHTAEDAAQTALVRTYAAWARVRRADAFAYARQVLVNHVTDRWRMKGREYANRRGCRSDAEARGCGRRRSRCGSG